MLYPPLQIKCCQVEQFSVSLAKSSVSKAIHPPHPPPAGLGSITNTPLTGVDTAKRSWQSCFTPAWLLPGVLPLPASALDPCKAREPARRRREGARDSVTLAQDVSACREEGQQEERAPLLIPRTKPLPGCCTSAGSLEHLGLRP